MMCNTGTVALNFPGGLVYVTNDTVRQALHDWCDEKPGRGYAKRYAEDGVYTCTLTSNEWDPIVGSSRLGFDDSAAQALQIAKFKEPG